MIFKIGEKAYLQDGSFSVDMSNSGNTNLVGHSGKKAKLLTVASEPFLVQIKSDTVLKRLGVEDYRTELMVIVLDEENYTHLVLNNLGKEPSKVIGIGYFPQH